jgi:hypothetical protein
MRVTVTGVFARIDRRCDPMQTVNVIGLVRQPVLMPARIPAPF